MNNTKDLVGTVGDLIKRGYNHEFRIKDKQLFSEELNKAYGMDEFTIDASYTFRTDKKGADIDREYLFALTITKDNIKGYLVDVYGVVDAMEANEVHGKFISNNPHIHHIDDEETKYGLPRLKKTAFNQAPERYVFRYGFPDFPPCPFGNKFEALGWDTQQKKYVWLVTSIIKDDRLLREHYH